MILNKGVIRHGALFPLNFDKKPSGLNLALPPGSNDSGSMCNSSSWWLGEDLWVIGRIQNEGD